MDTFGLADELVALNNMSLLRVETFIKMCSFATKFDEHFNMKGFLSHWPDSSCCCHIYPIFQQCADNVR